MRIGGGWRHLHANQTPAALIAEIRKCRGKDIWLMSGGALARDFLKADLVLYLGVVPILLGDGLPLFPSGFPQRDFALLENKTFSRGMVALKYKRLRPRAKASVELLASVAKSSCPGTTLRRTHVNCCG
jgi:dihydrofolate reductase